MTDHWLDSVLATPTVGIQLKATPSIARTVIRDAGSFLDYLTSDFGDVQVTETTSELSASTRDGFSYRLAHDEGGLNTIVQFVYNAVETKKAGGLPKYGFELADETLVKLLDSTKTRQRKLFTHLPALNRCSIRRMGINIRAHLSEEQMPPGVRRFKTALAQPFLKIGSLVKSNTTLLCLREKGSSEDRWDQCHHGLDFDNTRHPREYLMMLDYQRVWKEPTRASDGLSDLDELVSSALEYAQTFAFGDA